MEKIGFDSKKYIELQSKNIEKRFKKFSKLYIEFGGKLFDDFHASRVLPGFKPDNKLKLLLKLKDKIEIIIVINAKDLENTKVRHDLGISYNDELLRLIDIYNDYNLKVAGVVITCFNNQESAIKYRKKLEKANIQVAYNYEILDYPNNIDIILSKDGFGKNQTIKTEKNIIVVTAPGPGSGKLATCLSQIYNEHKNNIKAGYAKFETFPVWNLSLNHPVNVAYEAATIDLLDVNMIDPYHAEKYNEIAINYNRDVEAFPIVNNLLKQITGKNIYFSPTDMGVNMVGNAIVDDGACKEASKIEIIRRYYETCNKFLNEDSLDEKLSKFDMMFKRLGFDLNYRNVSNHINQMSKNLNLPVVGIEINNKVIHGKKSNLMTATAACLLNVLKHLANLEDIKILDESKIECILDLKRNYLNKKSATLNSSDVLTILSLTAKDNKEHLKALDQLKNLSGLECHSSHILSNNDVKNLKKLGLYLTQSPIYETKRLFQK